jgi:beta-N-acetylhexosaminidase
MLVAGDFELGGFPPALNGTTFGTQMGVGATNDTEFAHKMGLITGNEGKAMGFNVTFSPVVDINYNFRNPLVNLRAYSDNPDLVLKMALEFIRGVQEGGLTPTAKHFPGDGVDDRNQHFITSYNTLSVEKWETTFGKIYQGVIEAGIKIIMAGHIGFPAWIESIDPTINFHDKYAPASLSSHLNASLLREKLGFNGVIISDATGMVGLSSQGPRDEIVPKVIANGCDVFLFGRPRDKDYQRLLTGVETGIIPLNRLNDAALRVLALKASMNLPDLNATKTLIPPKSALKVVGCAQHKQWARECAEKSITLVKDLQGLIPINIEKYKRVILLRSGDYGIFTRKFKSLMKKNGFLISSYKKGKRIDVNHYDLMIYLITEPGLFDKNCIQLDFRKLAGMNWYSEIIPTIAISLGSPYHLYDIPRMKTYINAYGFLPHTIEILVKKLVGQQPFEGKSPVDPYCGLEDAQL